MGESIRFQHYEVLQREDGSPFELGRGAMGITYKAIDTTLRCPVALKVINSAYLNSEVARQRFLREARSAAAIRHPNVATVFLLGNEGGSYFYAMEFIDGETVESFMRRRGAVPTKMALEIVSQVTRALAAAEKQGLVHRDIKPSNLMLARDDDEEFTVKVIDFGLAKAVSPDGAAATLTLGGFLGTPHFASPEQLEERVLDVRADIYSLGATLFYMLSGRVPFSGSMAQVMSQHLTREPPFASLADQPPPVVALVERMMAKDPADRPQTPVDLRREVEACRAAVEAAHSGSRGGKKTEPADDDTRTAADAPGPLSAVEPAPGVTLAGRFELLAEFAPGAFGRTFRARCLEDDSVVAILILDRKLLPTSQAYTRLENEVIALQRVRHPAVLRIEFLEHAHHLSWIVREWVEGPSLRDVARERGDLPIGEALNILTCLAGGLDAVQQTGAPCPDLDAKWVTLAVGDGDIPQPKFNALNFAGVAPGELKDILASVLADPDAPRTERDAPPRGEYARRLAAIACELLGGGEQGLNGGDFVPLRSVPETANRVLRQAFDPASGYSSAVTFMARLSDALGDAPATTEPRPLAALPPTGAGFPFRSLMVIAVIAAGVWLLFPAWQALRDAALDDLAPTPTPEPPFVQTIPTPDPFPPEPTPPATPDPTPTPVDPAEAALAAELVRVEDAEMLGNSAAAYRVLAELEQRFPEAPAVRDRAVALTRKLLAEKGKLTAEELAELADPLDDLSQAGVTPAQVLLARSYEALDPDLAFLQYVAAEDESVEARIAIARMRARGLGTEPDPGRAVRDLREVIDRTNDPAATVLLGDFFRDGLIGPPDQIEARRLYEEAAVAGSLDAKERLAELNGPPAPTPDREANP